MKLLRFGDALTPRFGASNGGHIVSPDSLQSKYADGRSIIAGGAAALTAIGEVVGAKANPIELKSAPARLRPRSPSRL